MFFKKSEPIDLTELLARLNLRPVTPSERVPDEEVAAYNAWCQAQGLNDFEDNWDEFSRVA